MASYGAFTGNATGFGGGGWQSWGDIGPTWTGSFNNGLDMYKKIYDLQRHNALAPYEMQNTAAALDRSYWDNRTEAAVNNQINQEGEHGMLRSNAERTREALLNAGLPVPEAPSSLSFGTSQQTTPASNSSAGIALQTGMMDSGSPNGAGYVPQANPYFRYYGLTQGGQQMQQAPGALFGQQQQPEYLQQYFDPYGLRGYNNPTFR